MSVTESNNVYKTLLLTSAEFEAVRDALLVRDLELTAYISHEPSDAVAAHLRNLLAAVQSAKAKVRL